MNDSKVIVITGSTSGIGLQLKNNFKNLGYTVIGISRSEKDNGITNFACDVCDDIKLVEIFKKIEINFGKIFMLVNSAGYGISGITELTSTESAKHEFDVNFFGTLSTCKLCIPLMPDGGKIVNISSACAIFPLPFRTLYCASKSAVRMLSHSLALEVAPLGIEVTAICPGDIKSNFSANREKHFETNNKYGTRLKTATNKIDSRENKRMNLQTASNKILKICLKKHFKPTYIIGAKYKMLWFLTKLFPEKLVHNFIGKKFGK
ncbi:MAG: SDR family NAD(P)-dependent oxidoreductase [Clostridia bacterium]